MNNNKGIVMFIAIGTVLLVIVLANVVLSLMQSQSRLTHHQLSRIQAYYAAQAGINLAMHHLGRGDDQANWPMPAVNPNLPERANLFYQRVICRVAGGNCNIVDNLFPVSIQSITITVVDRNAAAPPIPCNPPGRAAGQPGAIPVCVFSNVDYLYTL